MILDLPCGVYAVAVIINLKSKNLKPYNSEI